MSDSYPLSFPVMGKRFETPEEELLACYGMPSSEDFVTWALKGLDSAREALAEAECASDDEAAALSVAAAGFSLVQARDSWRMAQQAQRFEERWLMNPYTAEPPLEEQRHNI